MRVQVLVSEDCPHRVPTLHLVRDVLQQLNVDSSIDEIAVSNLEQARRLRFLGSPTILIDGLDVEPERRTDTNFGMSCRLYGRSGTPPRAMVLSAILEACSK